MLAGQASCLVEREGGCAKPGSGEHGAVQRDAVAIASAAATMAPLSH
jgi:hypothetical protein